MGNTDLSEIEVVTDGDGLALIGPPSGLDLFLSKQSLESRDLELPRLRSAFGGGATIAKATSEISSQSGRWMKLTEESWAAAQTLPKVTNSSTGNLQATLRAPNGQFAKNLQFLKSPGSMLTNPAMLAGVAGIMAQVAMQQTMDEITDYLAVIDEKVDDVLRAQKDAVLADVIGVDMALEEAMTIRKEVGGVSEVTWSKIQGASMTIARTQAYALRQIDALAEKLESRSVAELADASGKADRQIEDWLSVLAHCFYLQEATGVVELDRVLQSTPEELDRHRIALRTARVNRAGAIADSTGRLLDRLDAASATANAKVLLNPIESPAIIRSRNKVSSGVGEFHRRLGVEDDSQALTSRKWSAAVADTRDGLLRAGGDGMEAAARAGAESAEKAREIAGSLAGLAGRTLRRRTSKSEVTD